MTSTPNLALPYIDAAQAQKHVTHNEALRGLDTLVQTAIATRTLSAPPSTPADGACYILAATGTGGWAGQPAATVAAWQDGIWVFYPPKTGWLVWVADEATTVAYTGSTWQVFGMSPSVPQLGINTIADATNKLAVKSPAILFDNTGNGAQVKINKAAATDTASLLYQDGYSGRSEMGLAGDDDFHLKVSPDGSTWKEALRIDRTSGLASVFGDPAVALGIATKQYVDAHSSTGTPGGSSGQLQYNNAGAFGGFTASGDATINSATGAVTLAANAVTNAKAAPMAAATLKGNTTGAAANPADLSAAQAKALLAISAADVSGLGALAAASSVSLTTQATGTLQAAQEPARTGDVGNTAGSLALTIAANAVTNAKAAPMAASTLKGNNTGATANALDLTAAQVKALLAIAAADVSGLAIIASTGNASDALWTNSVPQVGINTTADATNKLAVASAASLFNHNGAGHQMKLNKAAAANTASVLYQDNSSGRAEIGLTGDDNFHVKVSADGATFKEALLLDRTSGLGTVFGDPAVALGIATKQYVDAHSGGAAAISEIEIDFGASAVRSKKFLISDAAVLASSKVVPLQSGKAATGRQADENEMDMLHLRAAPAAGAFTLYAACLTGRVNGKFKINYQVG